MSSTTQQHDGQPPPDPDPAYQPDPRRWKALTVCLAAGFMALLDVSIVNVALPSIESGLGAGPNALQWVVSGYALAFGLVLVPAGRIGDARGRRPMLVTGLSVFVLASMACGLAPSPGWLIAARLAQGIGGGLIIPQSSGLIQQLFRGAERGRAFGALGATVGLSTALGPLVGGGLIEVFGAAEGWRAVFFVNLPIGALAVLLAFRFVPHTRRPAGSRGQDLDPVGVLLLGTAVFLVLLPLIESRQWDSPARWLLLPASFVVLLVWIGHERRHSREHTPVIDLALFTRRSYSLGVGISLLYFAGFTGLFFIYAQYLQNGLGYSALRSGLAVTPFALASAVSAYAAGKVVTRLGRRLVAVGLGLVVAGFSATWLVTVLVPGRGVGLAAALPLLVAGFGSGLVISPNITLTLAQVPVPWAGSAGGALQTSQRIGGAAGIAMTGSVFFGTLTGTDGDFADAFRNGLLVITAFVVAALALSLVDVVATARTAQQAE